MGRKWGNWQLSPEMKRTTSQKVVRGKPDYIPLFVQPRDYPSLTLEGSQDWKIRGYQAGSKPGHALLKRNYYLNMDTGFEDLNLHVSFGGRPSPTRLGKTLGDLGRREM